MFRRRALPLFSALVLIAAAIVFAREDRAVRQVERAAFATADLSPQAVGKADSASTAIPAAIETAEASAEPDFEIAETAEGAPAREPRPLFEEIDSDTRARIPSWNGKRTVLRERLVHVDVDTLARGPEQGTADRGDRAATLPFELFDDTEFDIVFEGEDEYAATGDGRVWIGRVAGVDDSSVTVAVQGSAAHALVQLPTGERYEIAYAGEEVHRIVELDPTAFPPEQIPAEAAALPEADPVDPDELPDASGSAPAGNSLVDVMVLYTPAARDAAGGQAAIETRIQQAIAVANTAYANSLVPITHQLVHQQLVDYDEAASSAFNTALDELTSTTDGVLDDIHTLRDQYGADVVSLLIDDWNYCGLGWVVNPMSSWSNRYGFNVNLWYCVGSTRTLHHEIGHNQGLAHDIDNAGVSGAFAYSYGLQVDTEFHTVMAYDSRYGCTSPCPGINHFSNPLVNYQGTPTGIFNEAENARSLTETRTYVANWRPTALPDADADGIEDTADNCIDEPNAAQMDSDSDGFGNMCDGDFDNNGFVTPLDMDEFRAAIVAFTPPGDGSTDMNGDGFVTPMDTVYFLDQLTQFTPGPSGLACAGTVPCSAP